MTAPVPRWQRQGYSIAAMRALAQRALPRPVFDFADGGAENERTLQRNEAAFGEIGLLPRPLEGAAQRHLSISLFDHDLALPLIVGPTGLSGLFWPDGERAVARAAGAAGTVFCLSHGSVCTLEEAAAAATGPRWMQVFVYRDRGLTRSFVERAQAAGYDGLVLTIDNQLLGQRERDLRNGFTIPPRFGPGDLLAMASKLPWLLRMGPRLGKLTFGNYLGSAPGADLATMAEYLTDQLDPALAWQDVEWLRDLWSGPLLIKGLLHPAEAVGAINHGADAVIVSNHGGRQLDGAVATVEALPAVVEAVAGRVPVLVDGGVRRGADVVRALALGATACLVGRPQLWGLAVAGEAGVAHMLELYRREIDRVMGLCGITDVAGINRNLLADWGTP